MLLNPATKQLVEYGVVGLVIAASLVAGLQLRPASILPSTGTLDVRVTGDPSTVRCSNPHAKTNVTSLVITVSFMQVHRTGALNLTGDWINITSFPKTIDLVKITNVTELVGSLELPEGTIDQVRLEGVSALATTSNGETHSVNVSSGHLDAQVSTRVTAGETTSLVVEPHLVCEGNGQLRLTPGLTATSNGPDQGNSPLKTG